MTIEFANPDESADPGDLHDASLVLRVRWGEVGVLFTGDAETATEGRIADGDHAQVLAADIYQVGHHGSSTSTTGKLLDAVTPAVAVCSAGEGNRYGHPYPEPIQRLRDAGVEIYGTGVHGTVVISTDGIEWSVATERDSEISIEPDGDPDPEIDGGCEPGQVDLNTASDEQLQEITHIAGDRAEQIIALRPFAVVAELTRVDGIGVARLADIEQQGLACVD